MSSLISASIKVSELKKIDQNKIIKGEKDNYIPVLISVNDESRYGKNVSISMQQTKEERDEKEVKHFLGNGSVIWTDGNVVKVQKDESQSSKQDATSKAKADDFDDILGF